MNAQTRTPDPGSGAHACSQPPAAHRVAGPRRRGRHGTPPVPTGSRTTRVQELGRRRTPPAVPSQGVPTTNLPSIPAARWPGTEQ